MIFAKMMFLPMLVKVLDKSKKPLVCAVLYALMILTNVLIFDLALGTSWLKVAGQMALAFFGSWAWFFALCELEGADMLYWGAFLLGFLLLLMF